MAAANDMDQSQELVDSYNKSDTKKDDNTKQPFSVASINQIVTPIQETGTATSTQLTTEAHPTTSMDDQEGLPLVQGVCGLRNLGNTCYMNAGLQCLCSVSMFSQPFLESPSLPSIPEKEKDPSKQWFNEQLAAHLGTLVRKVWSGQFTALAPRAFRLLLGKIYHPFSSHRQQDCQEFLAVLLDSLHENNLSKRWSLSKTSEEPAQQVEEMEVDEPVEPKGFEENTKDDISNKDPSSSTDPSSETTVKPSTYSSFVTEIFQGTLRNEVLCMQCSFTSVKREPFMYLSIPIPRGLEEQVVVNWFVPHSLVNPTRVLLTVMKYHGIINLKKELISTLSLNEILDSDIIFVEVKNSRIIKVLPNDVMLKVIDRASSMIVAMYVGSGPAVGGNKEAESAVIVQWHSCAICLEEFEDSKLTIHHKCQGMLCKTCLEAAFAHNPVCAVCQMPIDKDKDVVCMATQDPSSQDVNRLLQVTVFFRHVFAENDMKTSELFGFPVIINLPSPVEGIKMHEIIKGITPSHLQNCSHTLAVTGYMGRYCSRCKFSSQCSGCIIPKSEEQFTLKPGDYIAVSFDQISTDMKSKVEKVVDHSSMNQQNIEEVKLEECIELFSKPEMLGGENPWSCPQCKKQCMARHELKVQALPQTLIIQLKRFLFRDNLSSKVENEVKIPLVLEGKYLGDESVTLNLTGCVCHSGTLSAGHYTAWIFHQNTMKWFYCNDESVTECPSLAIKEDQAYILFYQQGNQSLTCTTDNMDFSWDKEVEKTVVEWLEPPKSDNVVFGPSLPRSSSDTQLSSKTKASSLADVLSLDDSTLSTKKKDTLVRKSLEDISGSVVLKSVKMLDDVYRT